MFRRLAAPSSVTKRFSSSSISATTRGKIGIPLRRRGVMMGVSRGGGGGGGGCHDGILASKSVPLQSQQLRQFAKNKKGGGGGRGGGGAAAGGGGGDKLQVYTVWSPEEEDIKDIPQYDKPEIVPKGDNLQKFIQQYYKKIGIDESDEQGRIKIYNSAKKGFEPLESMEQVTNEQKKHGKVFLAPTLYGAEVEYDDDDDVDVDVDESEDGIYSDEESDDFMDRVDMQENVDSVVTKLKEAGWKRHGDGIHLQKDDGVMATTKDIILLMVKEDPALQEVLVGKIGALDHIAMCVHFDFVWEQKHQDLASD